MKVGATDAWPQSSKPVFCVSKLSLEVKYLPTQTKFWCTSLPCLTQQPIYNGFDWFCWNTRSEPVRQLRALHMLLVSFPNPCSYSLATLATWLTSQMNMSTTSPTSKWHSCLLYQVGTVEKRRSKCVPRQPKQFAAMQIFFCEACDLVVLLTTNVTNMWQCAAGSM